MPRFSKKSTAGKHESSRRVSASTTAPSAPPASSSHMNQNRSWPGVPNRYSTSSGLIVIRPKSRATVVVVFDSTPARSSTPLLSSVISSSVRSGGISLIVPTMVVLPTPSPPAIRILTAAAGNSEPLPAGRFADSDPPNAIDHRLEDLNVGGHGRTEHDQLLVDEIADQDLHYAERQPQFRRHLGDRPGLLAF